MKNYISTILILVLILSSSLKPSEPDVNPLIGNWEMQFIYNQSSKTKHCTYFNADSTINSFFFNIDRDSFMCAIDCNPIVGAYTITDDKVRFDWEELFDYSVICDDGKSCLNPDSIKDKLKLNLRFEIINDTILNLYLDKDVYYNFIKY
jgi:hypothetical protein